MCFPHPEPQIATKTHVLGISTPPNGPWALGAKNCHGSNQKCSPGTLFGGRIFLENLLLYTNPVHTKTQTPYTHTRKHTHRFASVRIHTYTHTHKHTNLSPVAIYSKFNRCAIYAMSSLSNLETISNSDFQFACRYRFTGLE